MRNDVRQRLQTMRAIGLVVTFGLLVCAGLTGCGAGKSKGPEIPDDLIGVHGEVTLDGEPLVGALVLFLPPAEQVPWREAKAITDAEGKYELAYFGETKGTVAGLHRVKITCPDPNDIELQIVPEKYNTQTTLTEEVSPERDTIDFELSTK